MFWLTTEAYVTCCLNACFLYSGHPLYEATYGPLQSAHLGFVILFVRMIPSADQTFLFRSTGFSRVAETLAVVALHD